MSCLGCVESLKTGAYDTKEVKTDAEGNEVRVGGNPVKVKDVKIGGDRKLDIDHAESFATKRVPTEDEVEQGVRGKVWVLSHEQEEELIAYASAWLMDSILQMERAKTFVTTHREGKGSFFLALTESDIAFLICVLEHYKGKWIEMARNDVNDKEKFVMSSDKVKEMLAGKLKFQGGNGLSSPAAKARYMKVLARVFEISEDKTRNDNATRLFWEEYEAILAEKRDKNLKPKTSPQSVVVAGDIGLEAQDKIFQRMLNGRYQGL